LQFLAFLSNDQPIFAIQTENLATFLHIDTTNQAALIGLSQNGKILACVQNDQSNTHAEFVQVSIDQICNQTGIPLTSIDAIVNVMGPGSYTGLRVGLASAKGIAFALNKPIIGLNALQLLSLKAQKEIKEQNDTNRSIIFSMIDARRQEVFGGLYHQNNLEVIEESPMILSETFFIELVDKYNNIYCIGNGIEKSKKIIQNPKIHFIESNYRMEELIEQADSKWDRKEFENLAYSTPIYLKDFYSTKKGI
jgi:tRNA threonylcarbamoyladenosine biosynthesis protein TsaB